MNDRNRGSKQEQKTQRVETGFMTMATQSTVLL